MEHRSGKMSSCSFQLWISQQQQQQIEEFLKARTEDSQNEEKLRFLIEKNIKHYEEYHRNRVDLTRHDPLSSFSPNWCSSFEKSFLWIGGCRSSLPIQLIYTLCGLELDAQLSEFLRGVRRGNLGELSASQLNLVNDLHCTIVVEEEEISTRLTSLQEDIGDELFLVSSEENKLERVGESNRDVYRVFDGHMLALARVVEDADKLRLKTVKELIKILTPLQAVDFLMAAKMLHISMHEWGQARRI